MRITVAIQAMLFALVPLAASAESPQALRVVVHIHDYAHAAPQAITSAQRFVSDVYAEAGVIVTWPPPHRHGLDMQPPPRGAPGDLTIMMLSHGMASHYDVSGDTMGFAAVPAEGGGRIAYVLYDRIATARTAQPDAPVDLLGLVIGHEIGHLLLPRGSHSPTGLMRERWHLHDLSLMDPGAIRLTNGQAAHIRGRLGARSASLR